MAIPREHIGGADARVYDFPVRRSLDRSPRRGVVVRRRVVLALSALILALAFVLTVGRSSGVPASAPGAPEVVVVRNGDTLWDVAGRYAAEGVDPRAYVDAIVATNHLDQPLRPGTALRLPSEL